MVMTVVAMAIVALAVGLTGPLWSKLQRSPCHPPDLQPPVGCHSRGPGVTSHLTTKNQRNNKRLKALFKDMLEILKKTKNRFCPCGAMGHVSLAKMSRLLRICSFSASSPRNIPIQNVLAGRRSAIKGHPEFSEGSPENPDFINNQINVIPVIIRGPSVLKHHF